MAGNTARLAIPVFLALLNDRDRLCGGILNAYSGSISPKPAETEHTIPIQSFIEPPPSADHFCKITYSIRPGSFAEMSIVTLHR